MNIIENIIAQYKTVLVDNIYEYVLKDDEEYANERKEKLMNAFGLCYINKNNKMELLVVKDKGNTTIGTAYHEAIHAADYYMLSNYTKEKDIRKLQEDAAFRLWSEFRAEYFTYQYLIKEYGYKEDVYCFVQELTEEMDEFLKKDKIYLCDAVDFSVRIFGKYLAAWETNKEDFPKLPLHLFINRDFGRLCNFLYDRIEFDSIIENKKELEMAFKRLERNDYV